MVFSARAGWDVGQRSLRKLLGSPLRALHGDRLWKAPPELRAQDAIASATTASSDIFSSFAACAVRLKHNSTVNQRRVERDAALGQHAVRYGNYGVLRMEPSVVTGGDRDSVLLSGDLADHVLLADVESLLQHLNEADVAVGDEPDSARSGSVISVERRVAGRAGRCS